MHVRRSSGYLSFLRYDIICVKKFIVSAMQSPEPSTQIPPLPPLVELVEVPASGRSLSDSVSQLSQPSLGTAGAFTSPHQPIVNGQSMTPEGRLIKPIDEEAIDQGYDSDGGHAPWQDTEEVDPNAAELEEDSLPVGIQPSLAVASSAENVAEKMLTLEEAAKLSVIALKEELKKRGLNVRGLKAVLQERLKDAIEKGVPLIENMSKEKVANMAGDAFSPGAYWEELVCDGEHVLDQTPRGFHAPTVPAGEVPTVRKRNYKQNFDRMVFTGVTEVPKLQRNGRIATKKGQVIFEKKAHSKTTVNMNFIRKHNLTLNSHPALWFEAFLPIRDTGLTHSFSMEKVLSWTNLRALIDNASLGGKYKDFTNFTLDEIMRHVGLYLLQGLSPSPQIEMKFTPQHEDPVNGNDFVHTSFGGNVTKSRRRHRQFKSFFCSIDPRIPVPNRDTHPNWKVQPLLKHIPKVSQGAIFLGRNLSCDEQTIGFQGNHRDKQRITYKKEGDGFLADCICSDGYTYAFWFRHQEASKQIIQTVGCSPLHARVLALISQLPDKYYTLGMDNLYNSAKFCRLAYSTKQKVMVHGVTRPTLRGIPSVVKQDEVKRKSELESVRHTVKAAVLKGDEVCKELVSVSLYDTKPVYFLSMVCENITWMEKKRQVYNAQELKRFKMPFHRLNIVDFYNNNMGNVDLADQLRNHYRIDTSWHRNRKWWWSIWWWGYQVLLTNSYVCYIKYHDMLLTKPTLTHYEFIKQVALAWINKDLHWPNDSTTKVSKKRKTEDDDKRKTRATKKRLDIDAMSFSSADSRCFPITSKSLHPSSGSLNIRLNTTMQHLPHLAKKRSRCGLHRWARNREGKEVMSNVMTCSVCTVNLCITCFNIFHKEANLEEVKDAIARS